MTAPRAILIEEKSRFLRLREGFAIIHACFAALQDS